MKVEGYVGEFLSKNDIIYLHNSIIDNSEFNDDKGYIDVTGDLFDAAYHGIFAGFGDYELYPSILEKTVGLCFNIISSHVFSNANKRTGLMVLLQMLDLNDIEFVYSEDELFEAINGVGSGTISYEDLLNFVKIRIKQDDVPKR